VVADEQQVQAGAAEAMHMGFLPLPQEQITQLQLGQVVFQEQQLQEEVRLLEL
jgi:hypothetical protein